MGTRAERGVRAFLFTFGRGHDGTSNEPSRGACVCFFSHAARPTSFAASQAQSALTQGHKRVARAHRKLEISKSSRGKHVQKNAPRRRHREEGGCRGGLSSSRRRRRRRRCLGNSGGDAAARARGHGRRERLHGRSRHQDGEQARRASGGGDGTKAGKGALWMASSALEFAFLVLC